MNSWQPLPAATLDQALEGPVSGGATVWRVPSGDPVALHCQLLSGGER